MLYRVVLVLLFVVAIVLTLNERWQEQQSREAAEVTKAVGHASRVKCDGGVRSGKSTLTKAKANRFHNPVRNLTDDRAT